MGPGKDIHGTPVPTQWYGRGWPETSSTRHHHNDKTKFTVTRIGYQHFRRRVALFECDGYRPHELTLVRPVFLTFKSARQPQLLSGSYDDTPNKHMPRSLVDRSALSATGLFNTSVAAEKQVWSRQLFYILTLNFNGEALRRLENLPKGECAEDWRHVVEHHGVATSKLVSRKASSGCHPRSHRCGRAVHVDGHQIARAVG